MQSTYEIFSTNIVIFNKFSKVAKACSRYKNEVNTKFEEFVDIHKALSNINALVLFSILLISDKGIEIRVSLPKIVVELKYD